MKKLLIIFAFLCVVKAVGQEMFEVKRIGFSIAVPKDWMVMKNEEVLTNLNSFDLSDEQMNELLKSDKSAVNLVTYSKYDPKKYAGIIPTIKIRTRSNKIKNLESFRKSLEVLTTEVMKSLENFKFSEKPVSCTISGKEAVKFTVNFTMKKDEKNYQIASRSYYILQDGFYISLNFIEEIDKEDNSILFEKLVNSIQLTQ